MGKLYLLSTIAYFHPHLGRCGHIPQLAFRVHLLKPGLPEDDRQCVPFPPRFTLLLRRLLRYLCWSFVCFDRLRRGRVVVEPHHLDHQRTYLFALVPIMNFSKRLVENPRLAFQLFFHSLQQVSRAPSCTLHATIARAGGTGCACMTGRVHVTGMGKDGFKGEGSILN